MFLIVHCEIYFSFSAENGGSFVFVYFLAEKENFFFGCFYFTAKKVKSIFGRPLVMCDGACFLVLVAGMEQCWRSRNVEWSLNIGSLISRSTSVVLMLKLMLRCASVFINFCRVCWAYVKRKEWSSCNCDDVLNKTSWWVGFSPTILRVQLHSQLYNIIALFSYQIFLSTTLLSMETTVNNLLRVITW